MKVKHCKNTMSALCYSVVKAINICRHQIHSYAACVVMTLVKFNRVMSMADNKPSTNLSHQRWGKCVGLFEMLCRQHKQNCQHQYTNQIYYSCSVRDCRQTAGCPVVRRRPMTALSRLVGQRWSASGAAAAETVAVMHSEMMPVSCWCCLLDSVTNDAAGHVSSCHAPQDQLACSSPCRRFNISTDSSSSFSHSSAQQDLLQLSKTL